MKNKYLKFKSWLKYLALFCCALMFSFTTKAQIVDGDPAEWGTAAVTGLPTFTHVQDAFGSGVVDNQFAQAKDFYLAADMNWTIGQTKAKGDIANGAAVIIGSNLYFAGDRTSNNGDAQIGFWFFLGGTGPEGATSGSFAPPKTVGDLLILANFTNGGNIGTVEVYRWVGSGGNVPNTNGTLNTTNIPGIVAQNNNTVYPVPTGWNFTNTNYDTNEFYEGKIDLSSLGLTTFCASTFTLETRASQSVTAALDDFVGGLFGAVPLVQTLIPSCGGTGGLGIITMQSSEIGVTYQLYIGANAVQGPELGTGNSIVWNGLLVAGSYTVVATNDATLCTSTSGPVTVTLCPPPSCNPPTGLNLCPNAVGTYSTTTAELGTTYQWLLPAAANTSGAFFDPANQSLTGSSVTVNAGPGAAGQTQFDLTIVATNAGGTTSCTNTFYVSSNTPPTIYTKENSDLGCNPSAADITTALGTATATDNTGASIQVNRIDGIVTGTDCNKSQTRTFTATDACSITATKTVTVTWKVDVAAPSIVDIPDYQLEGCNANWPAKLTTTWTDNCGVGQLTSGSLDSDGGVNVIVDACIQTRLYTFTATDNCGNPATQTVTVSRKHDVAAPSIVDIPDYQLEGCNANWPAKLTTTWTDNCGVGQLTSGSLDSDGGVNVIVDACIQTRLYTFTATDNCGNPATQTVTVSRKWDKTPPELQNPLDDLVFECNEDVVVPVPVFLDNCDQGEISFTATINGEAGDPSSYVYPVGDTEICFMATDLCGNPATECITITLNPCKVEFCTYTQGKYGNQNGTACDLTGKIADATFVANLLSKGDLIIGTGSNTITFGTGDAGVLKSILPGGSGVGVISGSCDASMAALTTCLKPYLTKQGKLNNGLLAQTITLGLNLRIHADNRLFNFELKPGMLTTQMKLSCEEGSGVVEPVCMPTYSTVTPTEIVGYTMSPNPYKYYTLPAAVLCYMDEMGYDMTVGGLYALANDALGQKPGIVLPAKCNNMDVNLSVIMRAVDMINNAFDNCVAFVGYRDAKFACPELKIAKISSFVSSSLKVYPNPFTDNVYFEFVSDKDSHAVLEITNILGQKIITLLNGQVKAGVQNRIEFQPKNVVSGILIYRLIMNGNIQNGRIVYKK